MDQDHARFILRSGDVSRSAVAAASSLRQQADEQWLLAARVCEAVAGEYLKSGLDFAVSAFRPPGEWMGCWQGLDAMMPLVVVLVCPLELALARDAARVGRAHTGEASIRRAFGYDWERWRDVPGALVLDNSVSDPQVAIDLVEEAVSSVGRRP
jgi:hypothetical protein